MIENFDSQNSLKVKTSTPTKIKVAEESKEREILQRSSELLMECIKTLTKKLDTEIISRRTYQYEAEKDKQHQVKKIEQ